MLILLNPNANNGEGIRKWDEVLPLLEKTGLGRDYRLFSSPDDLAGVLRAGSSEKGQLIIAAGGDGTVNCVLNLLMALEEEERKHYVLGAVGLGSSNDFHKPHAARKLDGNVFFRLDAANAYLHNVGEVEYTDGRGEKTCRYFILNCSLGIIAQANDFFNRGNRPLDILKRRFVPGAIYYAALRTILASANVPAEISFGAESLSADVTNFSVVINPHFSGNLRYDFAIDGRSDCFGVALCEGMGIGRRLRTLGSLARGRFHGLPRTRTWTADELRVSTARVTALEMDGEVFPARDIHFRLLKGKLKVCPS